MPYLQSHPDPAARELIFQATTTGGAPATGLTFSAGEVQIRKPRAFGGAANSSPFVNVDATQRAAIVELVRGTYVYTFTAAELDTPGTMAFTVAKTGVQLWTTVDEVRRAYLGTVQAGTLTAGAFTGSRLESVADHWANALGTFLTGALAGQVRKCTGFTPGSPSVLAFLPAFTGAPTIGDVFELLNR